MRRQRLLEPALEQVLAFCAVDPIERIFLEDVARRGLGRFRAVAEDGHRLSALCHLGANVVPSGTGCGRFADEVVRHSPRMIIGHEPAVDELWQAARRRLPRPQDDRAGQPVYVLDEKPEPGRTELRQATLGDFDPLLPARRDAHREELGIDPLRRDPAGFRWQTQSQIEEGRSWIWAENGTILFKAEASAWTPTAVQLQQVWVDREVRNRGYAQRGMRDLCRLLLGQVPQICLFVRPENAPAIRVYEAIGMRRTIFYRSLVF